MDSQKQGRNPSECCWVWPGIGPVRVSLRPTCPEQEPRKTKGQRQALLLGTRGSASIASCPAQRPGSPARSAPLVSRGSFLAMLELSSPHAGQPCRAPRPVLL